MLTYNLKPDIGARDSSSVSFIKPPSLNTNGLNSDPLTPSFGSVLSALGGAGGGSGLSSLLSGGGFGGAGGGSGLDSLLGGLLGGGGGGATGAGAGSPFHDANGDIVGNPFQSLDAVVPGLGTAIGMLGIDFNCINASFPPKVAIRQTPQYINMFIESIGLNSINDKTPLEKVKKIYNLLFLNLTALMIDRKKLSEIRKGCTREGETLAYNITMKTLAYHYQQLEEKYKVTYRNLIGQANMPFRIRGRITKTVTYKSIDTISLKKPTKTSTSTNSNESSPSTDKKSESKSSFIWLLLFFPFSLVVLLYSYFNNQKK